MGKSEIGVIGLAVMGANLARNFAHKQVPTVVFNRTGSKTKEFMDSHGQEGPLEAAYSLQELAAKLSSPRKIILMVKAGEPVDNMIEQLLPVLEKGDIIIDGGNSYFEDTRRRTAKLAELGIEFVGMGVSGGEEGALNGPSLMPGCSKAAYASLEHALKLISAKAGANNQEPCVAYIGTDGAGHYVKMVHNGIEYADMQLIADVYSIMHNALGMDNQEIAEVFSEWNNRELSSYLIEITAAILKKKDELSGGAIVDYIMDVARQKGTGKWTSMSALELGVPTPTITEAVFARHLSCCKEERQQLEKVFSDATHPAQAFTAEAKAQLIDDLRKTLYAAKVCAYAQGFNLIAAASKEYNWQLDLGALAKIWRGGCIIRAKFLTDVSNGFKADNSLTNLLFSEIFVDSLKAARPSWGRIMSLAAKQGIAVIALSSALSYFDAYCTARGNANILQAQRDYFGAHTYERTDRPGVFHTDWTI